MHNVSQILICQQGVTPDDLLGLLFSENGDLPEYDKQEVQQLDLVLDYEGVISSEGADEFLPPALRISELLLLVVVVLQAFGPELILDSLQKLQVLFQDADFIVKDGSFGHFNTLEVRTVIHH